MGAGCTSSFLPQYAFILQRHNAQQYILLVALCPVKAVDKKTYPQPETLHPRGEGYNGQYYKYNINMWINKLCKNGTSHTVALPARVLRVLGWERGDFVSIQVASDKSLILSRLELSKLSDRQINEAQAVPVIHA